MKGDTAMKELAGQPDMVPRRPYWGPVLKEQPDQIRAAAAGCFS